MADEFNTLVVTSFEIEREYRLKKIEEAYDFGIEEYLDNAFLCIIEWPEIYEEELSDLPHHEMVITNHGDYREIVFH